ncbi:hypothetical protein M8494_34510 (plasmid) [Serratia ureilytica]
MAKSHTVEVQIDKNQERMAFIQLNAERLGWYLLPEFIDIAGFLPFSLRCLNRLNTKLCGASDTVRCQTSTSTIWDFRRGCFDIRFERKVTFLEWKPERSTG